MASMFIKLRVADFAAWKPVFDELEPTRRQAGFAREYASSQDLRQAMQRAGVQGPPEFWFAEDFEDKSY